jgi:two-component system, sensor histidine kinase LadS
LRYIVPVFFILIAFHISCKAGHPLVLTDSKDEYFLNDTIIEIFEDPENKYTIDQISSPAFQKAFIKPATKYSQNNFPGSAYWIRFQLKDASKRNTWILESYNFQLLQVQIYIPDSTGKLVLYQTGTKYKFNERQLDHKNFEFILNDLPKDYATCYIKFVSKEKNRSRFLFRTIQRFSDYSLSEYFLLGMFYGMLVIIAIYNLFIFTRLRDIAYFYYAVYALFAGLFLMVQDGTAFQYLWPNYPEWNQNSLFFCSTFMVVFMLLYTKEFLNTKTGFPTLNKVIIILIGVRISMFLIEIFAKPFFIKFIWIDIIPYLVAYTAAITSYRNKNKSALFFVLGFSALFLAFSINVIRLFHIIPGNVFTVYALNIGVILEMILLSLALAERVKQSRENELIKEKLNRELEQKVKERTEALMIQKNIIEEKVKTLDTFMYKASHDIKGPLKSLIGLTSLGLQDIKEHSHIYFEHALKTAKKLDHIVRDLLSISKINNSPLRPTEINFNDLILEIFDTFKKLPGYEQMHFSINVNRENKFYSEESLIYSILQNFIENAIKYRDKSKTESTLKINVRVEKNFAEITFEDNGIGIKDEFKEKIFDMFFTGGTKDEDNTGLGLYIVKLAVDKLGGKISVESKENTGTTFVVTLKNNPPA